jgi:anti-sigma28 factor (negative regulator of flagellin synthesis)
LDRVDVSEAAETAYRVVSIASSQREERVASLANRVQDGDYALDMKSLSDSILEFDAEPDYPL